MLILDVACGDKPYSLANVCGDLFIGATMHRNIQKNLCCSKFHNFIRFDATHLPFKYHSFDMIYARMILEHLPEPFLALKEWARVANKLYLIVPERKDELLQSNPMHLYSWSRSALHNLLKLVYDVVEVKCSSDTLKWDAYGRLPKMVNFFLTRIFNHFHLFNADALEAYAYRVRG